MEAPDPNESYVAHRLVTDHLRPFLLGSPTAATKLGQVLPLCLLNLDLVEPSAVKVEDLVRGLRVLGDLQDELLKSVNYWAPIARAKGASWTELGAAAGISKQAAQQRWGSASALSDATSPQSARAIQATINLWESIETEFGMLTSSEVARLIGTDKSSRSLVSGQRAEGKLIGVKRGNRILYPGFQFDREAGKVHPAFPGLLRMAKEVSWDEEDLILWLASPTGYFHGDRPVDHLNDADLEDKGRQEASVQW